MTMLPALPAPSQSPLTSRRTPHYFRDKDEIVDLWRQRSLDQDPLIAQMREIRAVVDGDIVLPLPELSEEDKPAVTNLVEQGLRQLGQRISSVEPTIYFPSLKPGQKKAEEDARNRTRILNGWNHKFKMRRRLQQRARYLLAYATAPALCIPDTNFGIPRSVPQDPLNTFPAEDIFDDHTPSDCIFASSHTYSGLVNRYGHDVVSPVSKPSNWDHRDDNANGEMRFVVLKYVDAYQHALILVGHDPDSYNTFDYLSNTSQEAHHVLLAWTPNLTGVCSAVVPGSINLHKQRGHFDSMVGMYQTQAALMALTIIGQRRAVWPREWIVSNPGESAQVLQEPDPAEGVPGIIQGGSIDQQRLDPNYATYEVMDRLESYQRQAASIPAEFGGFSQSDNVRTGRRGAQVMGAAIDFTIEESQQLFTESLVEEHKRLIEIDKAYFGARKTFYLPTRSFSGSITYTPSELWTTSEHIVDYPFAGVDLNNLPIEGGQRVEMGVMSRRRFMEIDPLIKDVESEQRQMLVEDLEQIAKVMIQTFAANPEGGFQPSQLMELIKEAYTTSNLVEAFLAVQEKAQQAQAAQAQTPAEAQPGLDTPGQGAQPPGAPPQEDRSLARMASMLGQFGTIQQAQRYRS